MIDEPTDQPHPESETENEDAIFDTPEFQAFLAGAASNVGKPAMMHEAHVHGSVIAQTVSLLESYTKPQIVSITEPDTGLEVYVEVSKDGVSAIPESLFDQFRDAPKHRRGTATLLSVDSFIAHVNRFKDADTLIFANNDRAAPSFTAILDYHRAGAEAYPRFGKHRSHFAFPLSDEWKVWKASNSVKMSMTDFAAFLEDNITNVLPKSLVQLSPEAKLFVDTLGGVDKIADPAKLMELATSFSVFENTAVKEARNLATGEAMIEFQSEHVDAAGQKLSIPKLFVLGIPVFNSGEVYQVIARLRYRKVGQSVVFYYDLWRTDLVFDHAFNESVEKVTDETNIGVLLGKDESKSL